MIDAAAAQALHQLLTRLTEVRSLTDLNIAAGLALEELGLEDAATDLPELVVLDGTGEATAT